jgi:iron-sulfur cluster assembly protein CyaY
MTMDEQQYLHRADVTFKRIEDMLELVDADEVDCERAGDVLTLTFKNGTRCIINTQRPTRQIWLAAASRAWHFDAVGDQWLDDKDKKTELFATIARIVKEQAGVDVAL